MNALIFNIIKNITLILSILGLIGNTLMFIVYCQSSLRKLSISVYFRAIAIVNLIINLVMTQRYIASLLAQDFTNYSQFVCKTLNFVIIINGAISAWLEVVAGLDRFLAIVYPTRCLFIRKTYFSLILIAILLVYNVAFYAQILFDFDLDKNYKSCISNRQNEIDKMDFYNSTAVPFAIMILTSLATLISVIKSRRRMESSMRHDGSRSSRTRMRDIKFGATLIIINITFLLLNAPRRFFYYMEYFYFLPVFYIFLLNEIVVFFYDLFYSTSFYLQILVNNLVRRQFCDLINKMIAKVRDCLRIRT